MDRKAVGFYAVAASASLGVLLSAGCGSESAQPARMAQREARTSTPAPVVVVSPEPHFFEAERPLDVVASAEPVASASVHDPYAETPDAETSVPTPDETPQVGESSFADVAALNPAGESDDSLAVADSTEDDPIASEANAVELRFAEGVAPVEESDAEKTISVQVGPKQKVTTRKTDDSRGADSSERRPLQPLVVTPRQMPGQPSPPPAAEVELAKAEPQISKSKRESSQVEPVVDTPMPAKVAEKPAAPQPAAPSKLIAAPVAIVATQPKPAPPQTRDVAKQSPAEVAKPAPVAEKLAAQPAAAEPVTVAPVVDQPTAEEPAVTASTPAKVEPAAEPPASPSTLRMAEIEIAKAPEAAPAVPAAEAPAAPVAAKQPPVAPVAEPVLAAKNTPAPQQPAAAPIAQVAPQPAPVQPAPVQAAPVQAAPVMAAQPQPATQAPPLPVAPIRSPALVASMAQADERVRHAIQLAEKGAMYASRKEFTSALTLISQARDIEYGTRQFSQSTAAGLEALKEANDFLKPGSATADLSRIVAGHKTPILKDLDVSDLPPSLAAQHYYDYAKVQLSAGIGRETVGSIALYGLGRIIVAGGGANSQQMEYTGPAMALYQAALICEPQNFRAAHELGVLLASSGQLELARNMLLGSAHASPQPMMWKNLAVVHARLGEAQLAAEAQQKATVLEQTSPNANTPAVQWVDPATFAQLGSTTDPTLPPKTVKPATASPAEAVPAKKPSNVARSRSQWDPLNLRR